MTGHDGFVLKKWESIRCLIPVLFAEVFVKGLLFPSHLFLVRIEMDEPLRNVDLY